LRFQAGDDDKENPDENEEYDGWISEFVGSPKLPTTKRIQAPDHQQDYTYHRTDAEYCGRESNAERNESHIVNGYQTRTSSCSLPTSIEGLQSRHNSAALVRMCDRHGPLRQASMQFQFPRRRLQRCFQ